MREMSDSLTVRQFRRPIGQTRPTWRGGARIHPSDSKPHLHDPPIFGIRDVDAVLRVDRQSPRRRKFSFAAAGVAKLPEQPAVQAHPREPARAILDDVERAFRIEGHIVWQLEIQAAAGPARRADRGMFPASLKMRTRLFTASVT